jgi:hypothetical protein
MPDLKSIAITPIKRGGGRKQPSPTVAKSLGDNPALQVALARPVRPTGLHRYRIGDRLRMNGGGYAVQRIAGRCEVMALLPYEGYGALLYRVRSEAESFERIVAEADLTQ